ncbi:hypothetical protein JZU46_04910 [bacterium]|jgi:hypothetical protein|nr:hypothetical protein [bacterium]
MEEYIGSQQHSEDRINEHYDREEEMNRQMEKDIQKQISRESQDEYTMEQHRKRLLMDSIEWMWDNVDIREDNEMLVDKFINERDEKM